MANERNTGKSFLFIFSLYLFFGALDLDLGFFYTVYIIMYSITHYTAYYPFLLVLLWEQGLALGCMGAYSYDMPHPRGLEPTTFEFYLNSFNQMK